MDTVPPCPLLDADHPSRGYLRHRSRNEAACQECRDAWALYNANRRSGKRRPCLYCRRPAGVDSDICHPCRKARRCGTPNGYYKGCRCDRCREAKALEMREYEAKRRAEGRPRRRARRRSTPVDHPERPCEFCHSPFKPKRSDTRFCSRRCIDRAWAGWSSSLAVEPHAPCCEIPPSHPARRPPPPMEWWTFLIHGPCRHCGDVFTALATDPERLPAYCSDRCGKAAARSARRARKKGAFVAEVRRDKIFERDGWRCQLCGKAVNRRAVVPHPKAPVLDHILPLAAGGTHEPANVQCAHFLCNSIKSDRPANDQLRLIG